MDSQASIVQIIRMYQKKFALQSSIFSFKPTGFPNRPFLYKLLDESEETFEFLVETSLIASSVKCERCGSQMKIIRKTDSDDGRVWFCGNGENNNRCTGEKNIRHLSFFAGSKLSIPLILILVFELFECTQCRRIENDIGISTHAVADWRRYVTDILIDFIETTKEKIGGPGRTVEIVLAKIGKRKFNRSQFVQGQWVFGGVERESGRRFLVAVLEEKSETLLALFMEWIVPGTLIISDGWKMYELLDEHDLKLLQSNHSLHFVDQETGAHTSTVKNQWHNFMESLPEYGRQEEFGGFVAWYMFSLICYSLNLKPYVKFLELIRNINWNDWPIVQEGPVE